MYKIEKKTFNKPVHMTYFERKSIHLIFQKRIIYLNFSSKVNTILLL